MFIFFSDIPLVEHCGVQMAEEGIPGIAWLENKLYVAYPGESCVRIFADRAPYEELEETIVIEGMKKPWRMTASAGSRSIFIGDKKSNCLWKIQMPEKELNRWELGGEPSDLSITPKGELLVGVTGFNKNRYCSSTCQLYVLELPNGSMKVIHLPSEIVRIVSVVQTVNENFVISYLDNVGSAVGHSLVSILSSDGQKITKTVKSVLYDRVPVSVFNSSNICSLTVLDDGQILACDYFFDEIVLLNSDLTGCRVLKKIARIFDELYYTGFVLIQEKQQLFVHHIKIIHPGVYNSFFSTFHLSPCYLAAQRNRPASSKRVPAKRKFRSSFARHVNSSTFKNTT